MRTTTLTLTLTMTLAAAPAALSTPRTEAAATDGAGIGQRLRELELRVKELETALAAARTEGEAADSAGLAELERRLEILSREIEALRLGEAVIEADAGAHGLGPAAAKVYRTEKGVSLAGYGEMLYQGFDSSGDDGAPSGQTDQLDFLRAITNIGYKFIDHILFNSELEFEHASTGKEGEESVEFAYLDFLFN
jgi:hypothetical protein